MITRFCLLVLADISTPDPLVGGAMLITLLACFLWGMWQSWKEDENARSHRHTWVTPEQMRKAAAEERAKLAGAINPHPYAKPSANPGPWVKQSGRGRDPQAPRKVL